MSRVRKGYLPKPKKPQKKDVPRLIDVLPTNGFHWRSQQGTEFLSTSMSRKLVKALRADVDVTSQDQVTGQLTHMFHTACEAVIQGNTPEEPADFWKNVAQTVPWMQHLDGETLQLFAMKALSARVATLNEADRYEANALHGKAEELRIETKTTQAADRYARMLPSSYSWWISTYRRAEGTPEDGDERIVLPAPYLPWWVMDSDNEGDEDTTIAYKKLLGKISSMDLAVRPANQEDDAMQEADAMEEDVVMEEDYAMEENDVMEGDGINEDDGYEACDEFSDEFSDDDYDSEDSADMDREYEHRGLALV